MSPTMPLNRVDLPAPFGPTTATSAPLAIVAVEMVHRRMAVVAERQIVKGKRSVHGLRSRHGPGDRAATAPR